MFKFNKSKKIKVSFVLDSIKDQQIYNNLVIANTFLSGEYSLQQIQKTFFANGVLNFMNEFIGIQVDNVLGKAEEERIRKNYFQAEDLKEKKQDTTPDILKEILKRNNLDN